MFLFGGLAFALNSIFDATNPRPKHWLHTKTDKS